MGWVSGNKAKMTANAVPRIILQSTQSRDSLLEKGMQFQSSRGINLDTGIWDILDIIPPLISEIFSDGLADR